MALPLQKRRKTDSSDPSFSSAQPALPTLPGPQDHLVTAEPEMVQACLPSTTATSPRPPGRPRTPSGAARPEALAPLRSATAHRPPSTRSARVEPRGICSRARSAARGGPRSAELRGIRSRMRSAEPPGYSLLYALCRAPVGIRSRRRTRSQRRTACSSSRRTACGSSSRPRRR